MQYNLAGGAAKVAFGAGYCEASMEAGLKPDSIVAASLGIAPAIAHASQTKEKLLPVFLDGARKRVIEPKMLWHQLRNNQRYGKQGYYPSDRTRQVVNPQDFRKVMEDNDLAPTTLTDTDIPCHARIFDLRKREPIYQLFNNNPNAWADARSAITPIPFCYPTDPGRTHLMDDDWIGLMRHVETAINVSQDQSKKITVAVRSDAQSFQSRFDTALTMMGSMLYARRNIRKHLLIHQSLRKQERVFEKEHAIPIELTLHETNGRPIEVSKLIDDLGDRVGTYPCHVADGTLFLVRPNSHWSVTANTKDEKMLRNAFDLGKRTFEKFMATVHGIGGQTEQEVLTGAV